MLPSLPDTVSAITYSLIREECDEHQAGARFFHNQVTSYVLEQQRHMPDYLRLPMHALTLLFDTQGIARSGRLFHRLPHEQRWQQIQRWRNSRLPFRTLLVRFYQGLVVYCWYAMLDECQRTR